MYIAVFRITQYYTCQPFMADMPVAEQLFMTSTALTARRPQSIYPLHRNSKGLNGRNSLSSSQAVAVLPPSRALACVTGRPLDTFIEAATVPVSIS
jgi:hypothetical protein